MKSEYLGSGFYAILAIFWAFGAGITFKSGHPEYAIGASLASILFALRHAADVIAYAIRKTKS